MVTAPSIGRFTVLVQEDVITSAAAVDVTGPEAWATAQRMRQERPGAAVSIMRINEEGDPTCVVHPDDSLE